MAERKRPSRCRRPTSSRTPEADEPSHLRAALDSIVRAGGPDSSALAGHAQAFWALEELHRRVRAIAPEADPGLVRDLVELIEWSRHELYQISRIRDEARRTIESELALGRWKSAARKGSKALTAHARALGLLPKRGNQPRARDPERATLEFVKLVRAGGQTPEQALASVAEKHGLALATVSGGITATRSEWRKRLKRLESERAALEAELASPLEPGTKVVRILPPPSPWTERLREALAVLDEIELPQR